MFAIYIVTLLALMGSEIVPSRVQSHSSDDDDNVYCKTAVQTVVNKIKHLQGKKDLPECTIGAIAKVDIFNANIGITTTVMICAGCNGPQVPITSSIECKNVPDVFRPLLDELCQIVNPRCKSITVYRCGSPVEFTTEKVTTSMETTVSPTPPVTTTQSPPPPTTTIPRPTTTIYMTPTPPEPTTQPPPPPTTTIPRPTTTIYMTPHLNPDVTIPW